MTLHYRVLGEGPALVVLHGLFGSGDNWQTLAREFSAHFKVYVVDQRNHGHSPHSPEMNYDVMAEDIFNLLAENGERDVKLLGHSMGGKTVLRFLQLFEFLVSKAVVADIGVKSYSSHHDHIFRALKSIQLDQFTSRQEVEDRLSMEILDKTTLLFLMKSLYWKEKGQLGWRFNPPVLEQHLPEILGALPPVTISVPTLFLRGEKSGYVPESDEDEIRTLVPNCEFRTIEGAGHWLHADSPGLFRRAVESFLLD